jgi:hypothetical protein
MARFVLGTPLGFLRMLEIAGLAALILALNNLITMQLAVHFQSMERTLSPTLFLTDFNPRNQGHALLSALNVMMLWYFTVLSIALARLTSKPLWKPAVWLFGLYALMSVGLSFLAPLGK